MSRNEITGDLITSRASNQDEYAKGWDAIFGKKQKELLEKPTTFLIEGGAYYVPLHEVTDLSAFGCQDEVDGYGACPEWCGSRNCVSTEDSPSS